MSARGTKQDFDKPPNVPAGNVSWPNNPRSAACRTAQNLVLQKMNKRVDTFKQATPRNLKTSFSNCILDKHPLKVSLPKIFLMLTLTSQ